LLDALESGIVVFTLVLLCIKYENEKCFKEKRKKERVCKTKNLPFFLPLQLLSMVTVLLPMLPLVILSPLPVDYCFSLIFNVSLQLLCYFIADSATTPSAAPLLLVAAAYIFCFAVATTNAASVAIS